MVASESRQSGAESHANRVFQHNPPIAVIYELELRPVDYRLHCHVERSQRSASAITGRLFEPDQYQRNVVGASRTQRLR